MAKLDLINTADAARMLGMSLRSIHRFAEDGTLVPVMRVTASPNGAYLFERADVEQLVKARSLDKPTMNVPLIGAGEKQSA